MAARSPLTAGLLMAKRDLRLAMRRSGEWLQPLVFFLVVTTLFPLALDGSLSRLRDVAPGALWVGALLSSLLALELLFRDDGQDGTLEQLALSGVPLACGVSCPRGPSNRSYAISAFRRRRITGWLARCQRGSSDASRSRGCC